MPAPWNNWYHCVWGTYGSWLYGDPRGFRTWRHRKHVEGDYQSPPPADTYADLYEQTRSSMKRDAVVLTPAEREMIAEAIVEKLAEFGLEWVVLAAAAAHVHLLIRFRPLDSPQSRGIIPRLPPNAALQDGRDPLPRHVIGLLKKHASHTHRTAGLPPHPGGLWAKRGKIIPIADRGHQVAVARYLQRHHDEGAAVRVCRPSK